VITYLAKEVSTAVQPTRFDDERIPERDAETILLRPRCVQDALVDRCRRQGVAGTGLGEVDDLTGLRGERAQRVERICQELGVTGRDRAAEAPLGGRLHDLLPLPPQAVPVRVEQPEQRVEGGDDFDAVLKDVLGPPGTSAAFLLIAVDLIISHLPKSQDVPVPFVACPELVSLDRTRQGQDQIEFPDLFGLKALEKEPVGSATRDSLKQRPSRRAPP